MERDETKNNFISINELQDFLDHLKKSSENQFGFTIDHLESSVGLTYDREYPSQSIFCLALLHEVLFNLKPSHVLWRKLNYAAFLLNIAERKDVEFGIIYNIFYQIEEKVDSQFLHWEDESVKKVIEDELTSKVFFKRKSEPFEDFESLDVKPNIEELLENINHNADDNLNELEIKSEESKAFSNNNVDCCNDDFDSYNSDVFNCNRELSDKENVSKSPRRSKTKIKYEEDPFQEILEPKIKKKTAKSVTTKKKILKAKKVKKENKSENGKVKYKKGQWNKDSKYRDQVRECKQCGFKAPYQLALDKHEFKEHQATRLCVQCGHISTTYEDFISHDKTHLIKCEQCETKVFGRAALKIHIRKHHEKKEEREVPCDVCGTLVFEKSLNCHKEAVHSGIEYKCDLCDYVTTYKYAIKQHKKRHFKEPQKCPECGKMFKSLSQHYRRSCPARQFERHKCDLCEKTFAMKHGLKKHIKAMHLGISEYQCDLCEYSAKDKLTLKGHVLSKHENKRLYSYCKICGKKTSNMEYHMKTYHMEEYLKELKVENSSTPMHENMNLISNSNEDFSILNLHHDKPY